MNILKQLGLLLFSNPQKRTMFCSYRSPAYADLVHNNCAMLFTGQKCNSGNKVFKSCAYKGCSYRKMLAAVSSLMNFNKDVIKYFYHISPRYLLPENCLLTPLEYMELTPMMFNYMINSNYFVRMYIDNDSFWTCLEQKLWYISQKNKKSAPIIYDLSDSDLLYFEMEEEDNPCLSYVCSKVRTQNMIDGPILRPLPHWGKNSDSIFLQQCPNCGHIMHLSKTTVHHLIKNQKALKCTHCSDSLFTYKQNGNYTQFTHYGGETSNFIKPINPEYVAQILVTDKLYDDVI